MDQVTWSAQFAQDQITWFLEFEGQVTWIRKIVDQVTWEIITLFYDTTQVTYILVSELGQFVGLGSDSCTSLVRLGSQQPSLGSTLAKTMTWAM